MALFKKKNGRNSVTADDQAMDAPIPKKRGKANKKSKNGMAKVLNESVPSAVQDELKDNEMFIHHTRKGNRYVALLLNVDDIGGLDKKSRKDEAKGAFIEAINSGNMAAVVTSELMDNNELVLIPTATTMSNMMEFSMLMELTYPLVYVDVNTAVGTINIEPVNADIGFEDLMTRIIEDEESIDDILADDEDEEDDHSIFSYDDDVDDTSGASEVDSYNDDDVEEIDDTDDIEDIDDIDVADEIEDIDNLDGLTDYETGASYSSGFDDGDIDYADIPDDIGSDFDGMESLPEETYDDDAASYVDSNEAQPQEEEDEVPDEWMNNIIRRKFYSDDLGLEITTEPFDAQFMQGNTYIPFEENRPDGWLNNQLNEMCRDANFEMEKMHQQNLFLMRERYFKLISRHCDRIVKDLDTSDINTQYGMIANSLLAAREQENANVEMRVARKKEDMEASWKRKLQEVGQDAARSAQKQYRDRYGSQHEEDIYNLEQEVRASIEDDYHDAVHEMNYRRRVEASKLLDLGISEVLEEISDMYVGALEDENARYQELQENMNAFLDDNRRFDIAQTKALEEELRQTDKADAVLKEQTAKMENMAMEFSARRETLEQDIARLQQENADRIRSLNATHEDNLEKERNRARELESKIDDLHDQNLRMHDTVAGEFSSRIVEKDNEIQNLHDRLDDVVYQQKQANRITTYLVIAITIAALAIGFVGGAFVNLHRQTSQVQQQLVDEYRQNNPSAPAENTQP